MTAKIFYSWQSDSKNQTNKDFIESVIGKAIGFVNTKLTDKPPLELVQAIRPNTVGSPEISSEVFSAIRNANYFIGDVSIINNQGKSTNSNAQHRPTPNPNVLVELGFAAGCLGWGKVIMVCNTSFGKITELPFDIRGRRVLEYDLIDWDPSASKRVLEKIYPDIQTLLYEMHEQQFSLERDPIVKILTYINNKILESNREWDMLISELFKVCNRKYQPQVIYTMKEIEAVCKQVNPLLPVTSAIDRAIPFENWHHYIHYKSEKIINRIKDCLIFQDKLDIQIIGLLTDIETRISGRILMISKDAHVSNTDLSYISASLFEIYRYFGELSKIFLERYKYHMKEYHKLARAKNRIKNEI